MIDLILLGVFIGLISIIVYGVLKKIIICCYSLLIHRRFYFSPFEVNHWKITHLEHQCNDEPENQKLLKKYQLMKDVERLEMALSKIEVYIMGIAFVILSLSIYFKFI